MYKAFILIFIMHFVVVELLQDSRFDKLKNRKKLYLFQHVGIYSLLLLLFSPLLLGFTILKGILFSLINGGLHIAVDFITNKFKNNSFDNTHIKNRIIVGIDTTMHVSFLILTFLFLSKYSIPFLNI